MKIAIYTLTSPLHDKMAVEGMTQQFLKSLGIEYELMCNNFTQYGQNDLDLIYVRTGGTEGIMKKLLPQLRRQSELPIRLLTSGKSNSLAASIEILSYLRLHGISGEIIHGSTDYIKQRIEMLARVGESIRRLRGQRLGIIGRPSDWLISSEADATKVKTRMGVELVEIPMQDLINSIEISPMGPISPIGPIGPIGFIGNINSIEETAIRESLPIAKKIYEALKNIVEQYKLQGFTLRCFDLLTAVHNTGCLALAKLNTEGKVAGCEGDVPTMLSMAVVRSLLGVSGFQANPSSIDPETGEMVFAHCTIPFDMVERWEMDTHFESGIGIGIRGYMKEGDVTIFKLSGDLSRMFVAEGQLIRNESKTDLCRTQQVILLADKTQAQYFLTNPIGNHHVIMPGHQAAILKELVSTYL